MANVQSYYTNLVQITVCPLIATCIKIVTYVTLANYKPMDPRKVVWYPQNLCMLQMQKHSLKIFLSQTTVLKTEWFYSTVSDVRCNKRGKRISCRFRQEDIRWLTSNDLLSKPYKKPFFRACCISHQNGGTRGPSGTQSTQGWRDNCGHRTHLVYYASHINFVAPQTLLPLTQSDDSFSLIGEIVHFTRASCFSFQECGTFNESQRWRSKKAHLLCYCLKW